MEVLSLRVSSSNSRNNSSDQDQFADLRIRTCDRQAGSDQDLRARTVLGMRVGSLTDSVRDTRYDQVTSLPGSLGDIVVNKRTLLKYVSVIIVRDLFYACMGAYTMRYNVAAWSGACFAWPWLLR